MADLKRKEKGKIWDELTEEETKANKEKNEKERSKSFSEWELAELEYEFMIQRNVDVSNGKKTIKEVKDEYVYKFDELKLAIDDREKFIKAIDNFYKQK